MVALAICGHGSHASKQSIITKFVKPEAFAALNGASICRKVLVKVSFVGLVLVSTTITNDLSRHSAQCLGTNFEFRGQNHLAYPKST